tara:strand:- start:1588 stop:2832 length:1245 start_codon:yes stop_codon:yes gene_type:complete
VPIKKGLSTLIDIDPNFSDQAIENSVNDIKLGWVIKSFELDEVITANAVLSVSQKNDIKDTINNVPYLNLGRLFGDLLRHTKSVIDGSILPVTDAGNPTPGTFEEILGSVQSLQGMIPLLYGGTAKDKSRGVNDHLGTLNNVLLESEDGSTLSAMAMLKESVQFIVPFNLSTETALETAYDNLKAHINTLTDDSTDIEHRTPLLTPLSNAVATAHTNFNNGLNTNTFLAKRDQMQLAEQKIEKQVSLENSNLTTIRDYIQSLITTQTFAGLGSSDEMAELLSKVSQAPEWINYYKTYKENFAGLNPIYTTDSNTDKEAMVDEIYTNSGLPDVGDHLDLVAVAEKAKRDDRIDTAGFDKLVHQDVITKACLQLNIQIANRSIYTQSELLLENMNKEDRAKISRALDFNESVDTLS